MLRRTTIAATVAFFVGMSLGSSSSLGLQSQEPQLSLLAGAKAEISRMDWVLLNAQVDVLRTLLVEKLKLPISPMTVFYDSERDRITWNANVDYSWYARATIEEAKRQLEKAALVYCTDGTMVNVMTRGYTPISKAPREYCSVRFSKLALDDAGELGREEVAEYSNGKLILN